MPKSNLDWLGVICLWIGAAVLAFKSAEAPLPRAAPPVLASGIWNYVPVILVSVALLIFIYRQIVPANPALNSSTTPDKLKPRIHTPLPEAVFQPPSTPERVYVSGTTSPRNLMALAAGKTSHEGQLVLAPFIGKWMRVEGVFEDLSVYPSFSAVSLQQQEIMNLLGVAIHDTSNTMFIFEEKRDRLEVLRVGDKIVVDGEITRVDRHHCRLEHCEIVQSG